MRIFEFNLPSVDAVRPGPPVRADIDCWLMDVPAIPAAGCDEHDARIRETGTRPIRDGHLRPVITTENCLSVKLQAARLKYVRASSPPAGLTWFLSLFHVRQHGEKTAVFFARTIDFTMRANYFQKSSRVSTAFFLDTLITRRSPSKNNYKYLKQLPNRCMSPSVPQSTLSRLVARKMPQYLVGSLLSVSAVC